GRGSTSGGSSSGCSRPRAAGSRCCAAFGTWELARPQGAVRASATSRRPHQARGFLAMSALGGPRTEAESTSFIGFSEFAGERKDLAKVARLPHLSRCVLARDLLG